MFFAETLVKYDPRITVVQSDESLGNWEALLSDCARRDIVAWDTETDGFNYFNGDRAIGHCFGYDLRDGVGARGVYFATRHRTPDAQCTPEKVTSLVSEILGDPAATVVTHHGSFDRNFAWSDGIPTNCAFHDTMIQAALIDENLPKTLEDLAERYGISGSAKEAKKTISKLLGKECLRRSVKKSEAPGFAWIPVAALGVYGAGDGLNTLAAHRQQIQSVETNWAELYDTERRLQSVLQRAEFVGQPVDREYLLWLHDEKLRIREIALHEIQTLAGYAVNPSKDDEIRELIYGHLRQPVEYWTSGGKAADKKRLPAVDAIALIMAYHRTGRRIFKAILEWRDANKIVTTYSTSILRRVGPDGRLHGRFDQVGAATGRLSSRDPNLQNFPASDEIRRAFLVPHGCSRLYMDFSQIELRILAFLASEPALTQAFIDGDDVHSQTSIRMFGAPKKSFRRVAKVINFGVAYGMSSMGVRDNLNKTADPAAGTPVIDQAKADGYLDQWKSLYPRVEAHKNELVRQMLRHRPPSFTNIFGRTRRIPLVAALGSYGKRGERQAIASEVQGTANELMKISMVRVEEEILAPLRAQGIKADLVGNIHDELLVDVDREHALETAVACKKEMEDFGQFKPIPIIADGEWTSTTWADKQSIWGD